MNTAATIASAVLSLLALAVGVYMVTRPRDRLPRITRRSVAVVSGESTIHGVLVACYRDVIVLSHAMLLGEPAQPLEGEVLIPRGQVRFVQDLAPAPSESTS